MRVRPAMVSAFMLSLCLSTSLAEAQSLGRTPPMILALGNTGFLNARDIEGATGALVKPDMENFQLNDFSVIILANVALGALPSALQQGLVRYVTDGGTVLITGGGQSFGSGGYQAVAAIIPFQIRSASDWRATPFRPPVPLQPGHPILAGVTFITVGSLNDMNPRSDATEVLRAAGGGSAARCRTVCDKAGCRQVCPPGVVPAPSVVTPEGSVGGSYSYPLIAEIGAGAGRVIGIAFDLNDFAGMPDRNLFVRNTLAYLLHASRLGQAR